jgi:hypothetical protein
MAEKSDKPGEAAKPSQPKETAPTQAAPPNPKANIKPRRLLESDEKNRPKQ